MRAAGQVLLEGFLREPQHALPPFSVHDRPLPPLEAARGVTTRLPFSTMSSTPSCAVRNGRPTSCCAPPTIPSFSSPSTSRASPAARPSRGTPPSGVDPGVFDVLKEVRDTTVRDAPDLARLRLTSAAAGTITQTERHTTSRAP